MAREQDEKPIEPSAQSLTEKAVQQPQVVEIPAVEIANLENEKLLNFLLKEFQEETNDEKRKSKLELINSLKDLMFDVRKKEIELETARLQMQQGAKDTKRSGVLNVIREIGVIVGILSLFIILGISAYYTFKLGSNVGLFLMCLILSIIAYGTYVSEFSFSFKDLFKFEGKAKNDNVKKP